MLLSAWKYLSMGLVGTLVVGLTFPQAFAHVSNNTAHMLQHIYDFVDGIEAKTNNLPSDPASATNVSDAQQAIESAISTAESDINSNTNSAVGGLASQTTAEGIKAKTDLLPDDPSDQSLLDSQLASIQSDTDEIQSQISGISSGGSSPQVSHIRYILNPPDNTGSSTALLVGQSGKTYSGVWTGNFIIPDGNTGKVYCVMQPGFSSTRNSLLFDLNDSDLYESSNHGAFSQVFTCYALIINITDTSDGVNAPAVEFETLIQYVEISD